MTEQSNPARGAMPEPTDFSREPEKPVFAMLDRLRLAYRNHIHAPVFTVAESAQVKTDIPGGHTKNLFMKDKKGQLVLISAWAESQLPLNQVHKELGTQRLSFTDAPLLWDALGVTPGSVTGLALMNDPGGRVKFVADAALLAFETVNFHPLRNDMTVSLKTPDFLAFVEATGHTLQRVDFTKLGPS
ncbi:MAG TPA: prolyl-tRNA synthetase associated domain-containing protein [Hyphomonadaceae bacterium]|nr:prolyl-tRNA synthetase associated domain-containing protein [Hyphomonadaceae bacterium]